MTESAFGDTYTTGTISISNGSKNAVFVGSLMTTQAEAGDLVLLNNLLCYVDVVVDDTHLTFLNNWTGTTIAAGNYVLMKTSKYRYDVSLNQKKQRELLA